MHYHLNRLKWKIRNNYVFFIIMVIICAIVATVFAFKAYNLDRYTTMEALLDKSWGEMHWGGGITDTDIEKLRKVYPNFDWEKTMDRQRWLLGNEDDRIKQRTEMARQSRKEQKEKSLYQLKQREKKALGW